MKRTNRNHSGPPATMAEAFRKAATVKATAPAESTYDRCVAKAIGRRAQGDRHDAAVAVILALDLGAVTEAYVARNRNRIRRELGGMDR